MKQRRPAQSRDLRAVPLAAAVWACMAAAPAFGASFGVEMPAIWQPGNMRGVAVLFDALRAAHAPVPVHVPRTIAVHSCADNKSAGTLRSVIATAGDADTIDLGSLACSRITLQQGAIPVITDNLTVRGPGTLAIDGAGLDRVFVHYGSGTLRLEKLRVRNGVNRVTGFHVAGGACILSGGSVTLDHSSVEQCLAAGEGVYGGGILAGTITLYSSTLSGNTALGANPDTFTAAYGGGAMAYFGVIGLYDSSVTGNRAAHDSSDTHGSYCTGGGVFADFGGYALRSTVAGNYSYGTGGGLAAHAGIFLADSTISGNTAKFKPGGGLFVRSFDDSLQFNNSTIAFNQAPSGAGLYVLGQPRATLLQSTIVAENRSDNALGDLAASSALSISGSHNLVMSASAGIALPADTLHEDPQLLALADNGGPTRTHALARGSPAREAGANPAGLTTDQRGSGYARVVGASADIGALEMVAPPPRAAAAPGLPAWGWFALAGLLACSGARRMQTRRAPARRMSE